MTERKSFVFHFGDVEVREREFTLIKAGEVLPVEPKILRVLLFLLHNPQRLTTKEELLNAVWGDTAVTESSLTRIIALLRRLLGDDFREPRYIATVAKIGYRFVCPVEISEDAPGIPASADSANPGNGSAGEAFPARVQGGGIRTFRRRWLPAATVLAVGLAVLIWYLRRPLPPLRISEYTQITHDGRHKALFGTDGIRFFLDRYPSSQPLVQVAISGGEIAPIPVLLPNPWVVDVSPDGTSFLITSSDGNRGSLWSVGALGSSLRHLTDGDIGGAAWSPDAKSVVYSTSNGDLDVMRNDGTEAHRLTSVPYHTGSPYFEQISWSPDGSAIRFDRNNKIFEVSPDGSGLHPFLPGWRPGSWQCCGRWTPDGKSFLFLSWDGPTSPYESLPPSQIWVLNERRGPLRGAPAKPVQLTSGPIRWGRPVPSRDGKKIFARGVILNGELERLDAQSHQLRPYLGGVSAEAASFSKDGRFVAYVTFPEGILWRAHRDGSNPTRLTDPPLYPTSPNWSPDGTQILFSSADAAGSPKGYFISSEGGIPRSLLPGNMDEQGNPNWSRDGRKIAFDSWETAGGTSRQVIRILDLASHQITTLPGSPGINTPCWSPDGRFIAGLTLNTSDLAVFDLETQRWLMFHQGPTNFFAWSRDGRFIYFMRVVGDSGVFRIRSSGGKEELIVDLNGFRHTGVDLNWMGLDPEDAPLLLRDAGGDDIYSLTLEQK